MTLHISEDLPLPDDLVTRTLAILAIKGAGKTYAGSVLAEELLEAQLQIVVLDPTGAWWGLRVNARGTGTGYPVVIFGGEHADLPLDAAAGAAVADAIVDLGISAILDLSGFSSKGEQRRFAAAFAERLYRAKSPEAKRTPLMLIVDEADEFVPQRFTGDAAAMVGAFEQLTKRGRIRAIGITLISQRAAAVNKDVLTQCGMLIALRTVGKRDRVALEDWIEVHGTAEQRGAMMAQIAGLPTGTAWVWDAEHDIFRRIQIRRRRTYDSSATPKPGEVRRAVVLKDIDIPRLGERLEASIERAKADDPRELRRRIAELERRPATVQKEAIWEKVEVPVSILEPADREQLRNVAHLAAELWLRAGTLAEEAETVRASVLNVLDRFDTPSPTSRPESARVRAAPLPSPAIGTLVPAAASNGPHHRLRPALIAQRPLEPAAELTPAHRRVLDAIAWWSAIVPPPIDLRKVAFVAGYSAQGGGYGNLVSRLSSMGLLQRAGKGMVMLTDAGVRVASPPDLPASDSAIHALVLAQLRVPALQKILAALLSCHPQGMSKEELAAITGYEPTGGGFGNYVSRLVSLEFVRRRGGLLYADDSLFIAGQRREAAG